MLFQQQIAPRSILRQARQLVPFLKALGEIGMQFSQHFAAPALWPEDPRDGDELSGYSTISNS